MQFSTKIDGFEQKDSQGFENSYNSYEQYPLEKFFIFTIYQNYPTEARWMTWLQPVMEAMCCLSLSSSLKWHLNVCGHYWLKTLNSYLITYKFLLSDIFCEFEIYPWKWFTHQLWFVFNKKVQTIMHSVKRAESINRIRSWWLSSFLVEHL